MKSASKIILSAVLAVLVSLGSLYLSEHTRAVNMKPGLRNAIAESGSGSSSSGASFMNPDLHSTGVERVCAAAFPMRVAWIANGRLCLLDGTAANARPVQVNTGGFPWISGWSPDGRWVAFSYRPKPENYSQTYLWVVRADGTGAYQVDQRPVSEVAAWSPTDEVIAYGTEGPVQPDPNLKIFPQPDGNLKIARISDGQARVTTLLPENSNAFGSAWTPDGRSLAVSFPHLDTAPYSPLHVDRLTLEGKRTRLFSVGEAGRQDFYLYLSSADGLKFSPDGRYLAYHLGSNAASFSADSEKLQVTDLQTGQNIDLGKGLSNPDWFAWSPDSRQLAFILGEGRWPSTNKKLQVLNVDDGKIADCSQQGEVDTYPLWTGRPPYSLIFCRGPENPQWGSTYSLPVPGQRIWARSGDRTMTLTAGPANTEDEIIGVSPDGKYLAYLRLTDPDSGSLYLKPLEGGRETELLRLSMPKRSGIQLFSTWAGPEE
ncbi:MAG: hypothetical protein ABSC17_10845 [Thermacetogeniaceae bacterium]